MLRKSYCLLVLFSFVLFFIPVRAEAGDFIIDPAHSNVIFKIKHMGGQYIGAFERFGGVVGVGDNNAISSVNGLVDVTSVTTRNRTRDDEILGEELLDAEKHPIARFVGKKIENNKIIGDLTLKGKTKQVALECWISPARKTKDGTTKMTLMAKGTFKRKDFGIQYNRKLLNGDFLIGDDVELQLEILAVLKN